MYDYLYKIIIIGDLKVGKTSLIRQYIDNKFDKYYTRTVDDDFKITTLLINDKVIKLQIWDLSYNYRIGKMPGINYKGKHSVFLLYDVTNRESFTNLNYWLKQLNVFNDKSNTDYNNRKIIIIGNKTDLINKREVLYEEAYNYAISNNTLYFEISCKDNINIKELFKYVAYFALESDNKKSIILDKNTENIKSKNMYSCYC
jgi:small GTP-binding protein